MRLKARSSDDNTDASTSQSINSYKTMAELAKNVSKISDTNVLQTALAAALRDEDYQLAAKIRDRMKDVSASALESAFFSCASTQVPWCSQPIHENCAVVFMNRSTEIKNYDAQVSVFVTFFRASECFGSIINCAPTALFFPCFCVVASYQAEPYFR